MKRAYPNQKESGHRYAFNLQLCSDSYAYELIFEYG